RTSRDSLDEAPTGCPRRSKRSVEASPTARTAPRIGSCPAPASSPVTGIACTRPVRLAHEGDFGGARTNHIRRERQGRRTRGGTTAGRADSPGRVESRNGPLMKDVPIIGQDSLQVRGLSVDGFPGQARGEEPANGRERSEEPQVFRHVEDAPLEGFLLVTRAQREPPPPALDRRLPPVRNEGREEPEDGGRENDEE